MARQKKSLSRRFWNGVLVVVLLPIVLPLALISLTLYGAHRITLYILIGSCGCQGEKTYWLCTRTARYGRNTWRRRSCPWCRSVPLF